MKKIKKIKLKEKQFAVTSNHHMVLTPDGTYKIEEKINEIIEKLNEKT